MAKIIVEFGGWVECDSDKVKFLKLATDDVITGTEWLELSEDDRDNYIDYGGIDNPEDSIPVALWNEYHMDEFFDEEEVA